MQVLIIDDEPIALDILEMYIRKMPGLELAGRCKNAVEAFGRLSTSSADLVFLDINMPEISGIDFIKTLKEPPPVVFTTAYSQFAVESYELNAIDYLLKPISFERFVKAVHKAQEVAKVKNSRFEQPATPLGGDQIIFVKTNGKLVKTDLTQLWLIEGLKDYVCFWTDTGKIIVHTTMKNLEEQLRPFPHFVRVNKSFIINMNYIREVDGHVIRIKDQLITIGNTYRDDIHKLFDRHKLQ